MPRRDPRKPTGDVERSHCQRSTTDQTSGSAVQHSIVFLDRSTLEANVPGRRIFRTAKGIRRHRARPDRRAPARRHHRHHQQGAAARGDARATAQSENDRGGGDRHGRHRQGLLQRRAASSSQTSATTPSTRCRNMSSRWPSRSAATSSPMSTTCAPGRWQESRPVLLLRPSDPRHARLDARHHRLRRARQGGRQDRRSLRHEGAAPTTSSRSRGSSTSTL